MKTEPTFSVIFIRDVTVIDIQGKQCRLCSHMAVQSLGLNSVGYSYGFPSHVEEAPCWEYLLIVFAHMFHFLIYGVLLHHRCFEALAVGA